MAKSKAMRVTALRAGRRAARICLYCASAAVEGSSRCAVHVQQRKKARAAARARARVAHEADPFGGDPWPHVSPAHWDRVDGQLQSEFAEKWAPLAPAGNVVQVLSNRWLRRQLQVEAMCEWVARLRLQHEAERAAGTRPALPS